jgi:hypothetical protein
MRVLFAATRGAGHFNPLADPTHGESAAAIADEMRSLPPTDAALPTLETAGFV